jgi:hypothetical protein
MSFSELQQIPKPVTIAQAMFNLPVGKSKKDKRLLTIAELPWRNIPGKWNVSVFDLITILDDLPEGHEIMITRNDEEV